jgi:hypothetical protein
MVQSIELSVTPGAICKCRPIDPVSVWPAAELVGRSLGEAWLVVAGAYDRGDADGKRLEGPFRQVVHALGF